MKYFYHPESDALWTEEDSASDHEVTDQLTGDAQLVVELTKTEFEQLSQQLYVGKANAERKRA